MRRLHLVDAIADERGIMYRASDDTPAIVSLMRTKYAAALKDRAKWLVAELADLEEAQLTQRIASRIGRWSAEFQGEASRPGNPV